MAVQFKKNILALQKNLSTEDEKHIFARLNRPQPRVEAGLALRGLAQCAIDISDGLAADLGHILNASHVGATLNLATLPISSVLTQHCEKDFCWDLALNGGDDYELCFTVSPDKMPIVKQKFSELNVKFACIGYIEEKLGLRLMDENGEVYKTKNQGYTHF
jgi:thiamine-monophosphate kinase